MHAGTNKATPTTTPTPTFEMTEGQTKRGAELEEVRSVSPLFTALIQRQPRQQTDPRRMRRNVPQRE
jgi:hypothetical protein